MMQRSHNLKLLLVRWLVVATLIRSLVSTAILKVSPPDRACDGVRIAGDARCVGRVLVFVLVLINWSAVTSEMRKSATYGSDMLVDVFW